MMVRGEYVVDELQKMLIHLNFTINYYNYLFFKSKVLAKETSSWEITYMNLKII